MRNSRFSPITLALVLVIACLPLGRELLAKDVQSTDQVTAILTSGEWNFGGRHTGRFFNADGTYRSSNATVGVWRIANKAIEVSLGEMVFVYPLPVKPEGTPGTDHKGRKSLLIRVGEEAPSAGSAAIAWGKPHASAGPQPKIIHVELAASQIVQAYHDSLVFATGTAGAGSGFIASIAGSNFLVTNVHVAAEIRDAEFKSLNGAVVHGGVPSMAIGEDIFCMALPAGGRPFPVMQYVDQNAAIGDDVAVLGNVEGEGVVKTLTGRIVGIGPNLVEVDAPIVPGNSGSPIIDLKTGNVVGVATYTVTRESDDLTTKKKAPQVEVRRFGYRIDNVKGWQAVNWAAFDAQAALMDSITQRTDELESFFKNAGEYQGVATADLPMNSAISGQIKQWKSTRRPGESPDDVAAAGANFLTFLKVDCESDLTAAQSRITYDYFRRELADQKRERDEMAKALGQIIEAKGP